MQTTTEGSSKFEVRSSNKTGVIQEFTTKAPRAPRNTEINGFTLVSLVVVNRTAEEFHGSDSSVSRDAQELKHLPPTDR